MARTKTPTTPTEPEFISTKRLELEVKTIRDLRRFVSRLNALCADDEGKVYLTAPNYLFPGVQPSVSAGWEMKTCG